MFVGFCRQFFFSPAHTQDERLTLIPKPVLAKLPSQDFFISLFLRLNVFVKVFLF